MSQWGMSDAASNSVLWAPAQFKKTVNSANRDALFGNTTADAFVSGQIVGAYGVDAAEVGVKGGPLLSGTISDGGSGYAANATVTLVLQPGGTTNATAVTSVVNTSLGTIESLVVAQAGTNEYQGVPGVIIAAPAAINITANSSGFSNTDDTISIATANSLLQVGDRVTYAVPTNNTAIAPLVSGQDYYVSFSNTTVIALSETLGGANVDIVDTRDAGAGETHTLTGETATGVVSIGGTRGRGVAHAGWVLRREGTGGRAGRVQTEVLVAGGIKTDAADDTYFPDA